MLEFFIDYCLEILIEIEREFSQKHGIVKILRHPLFEEKQIELHLVIGEDGY